MSFGTLYLVALVRTDVSEKYFASIFRVTYLLNVLTLQHGYASRWRLSSPYVVRHILPVNIGTHLSFQHLSAIDNCYLSVELWFKPRVLAYVTQIDDINAALCRVSCTSHSAGATVLSPAGLNILPVIITYKKKQTNSVALSPQANYTNWATATCWRNLVPTFVDRGVSRGQRGGSPTVPTLVKSAHVMNMLKYICICAEKVRILLNCKTRLRDTLWRSA
jgi:hypothetical protein